MPVCLRQACLWQTSSISYQNKYSTTDSVLRSIFLQGWLLGLFLLILLIRFLTSDGYLEIPFFQHDFDNIEQLTHEDDRFHGVFGDHIIRNKLEPLNENFEDILGETACDIITTNYKWFYDVFEYKI